MWEEFRFIILDVNPQYCHAKVPSNTSRYHKALFGSVIENIY